METTFNQTTVSRFYVSAVRNPNFYGIENRIENENYTNEIK